jgi:hypothetical protein
MQTMVTQEAGALEIDPRQLSTLDLAGSELPYVDMEEAPAIRNKLSLNGTEYTYVRSFPIQGHSALMPGAVAELQAQSKRILIAERKERYYVFAA